MNPAEADVRAFLLGRLETRLQEAGMDPATLSDDVDLFAAGVIDSLGVVELIAVVSDRYGIDEDWEDYDPDDLLVIGPFCRYVAQGAADGRAHSAVTELRPVDERQAPAIAPMLARWAYEAGFPLDDWRFGGESQARANLEAWVLRPSSEVAAGRWQIAFRDETPEGGYVAMQEAHLSAARRADLLALVGSVGDATTLSERLAAITDLFLPVVSGDLYLSRIAVEQRARGRGVGSWLLSQVVETAARTGATAVRADVSADNNAAIALYRSAGFDIASQRASDRAGLAYCAVRLVI